MARPNNTHRLDKLEPSVVGLRRRFLELERRIDVIEEMRADMHVAVGNSKEEITALIKKVFEDMLTSRERVSDVVKREKSSDMLLMGNRPRGAK